MFIKVIPLKMDDDKEYSLEEIQRFHQNSFKKSWIYHSFVEDWDPRIIENADDPECQQDETQNEDFSNNTFNETKISSVMNSNNTETNDTSTISNIKPKNLILIKKKITTDHVLISQLLDDLKNLDLYNVKSIANNIYKEIYIQENKHVDKTKKSYKRLKHLSDEERKEHRKQQLKISKEKYRKSHKKEIAIYNANYYNEKNGFNNN